MLVRVMELSFVDKSGEKAFKLYLVQVGTGWVASRVLFH